MKSVFAAVLALLFAVGHASADAVEDYVKKYAPTALVIVQNGKVVGQSGDPARKVNIASVRKSLLSALYGIAVAEGRIRLDKTLADLGIDDKSALTEAEKKATVRDLLTARSGIYLAAAYETADIKKKRPTRGRHAPGTQWFYNNWDFNALGTIYRKATGEDIFESFEQRIAQPIGMQDFTVRDGRYVQDPSSSHPAYPFYMSARDLARFGQLWLDHGVSNGKQIIPAAWIEAALTPYSATDRSQRSYGYLWWTLDEFGPGAALASGYGGQLVAVIPAKRLVVVQTVDGRRLKTPDFITLLKNLVEARP